MRTELHFHLLPAVDDGPRDPAEALDLARAAVADGTRRVTATPHVCEVVVEELPERVRALQALLERAGLPLEVKTGGELGSEDVAELTDAQLELLAQGPPAHRWLLLEAPLVSVRRPFADAAAELRSRGYDVLMGHPERSPQTTLEDIEAAVAEGSVLQLNASSLVGVHGTVMRDKGLAIARSGLPFVLASDAHSPARPPLLTPAAETLRAAGLDPAVIALAVDDGPPRLLDEGLAEPTRSATALSGR